MLTNEQKLNLIEQRLLQFQAEKYQHELNKQVAEAVNDTAGVQTANEAIAILESAIAVHETEKANLV